MTGQCKNLVEEDDKFGCLWNTAIITDPDNCTQEICPEGYKEK